MKTEHEPTGRRSAGLLRAFLLAILALVAMPPGEGAAAAGCGEFYTVARGDTLHLIAVAHYGRGEYQAIYDANRDILPSVTQLDVGEELWIPCLDGSGPQTRAQALASGARTATPTVSAAAVTRDSNGLGFLTGSDFAPFADERLPQGGMITELVRLALARAAPGREVSVTFVNDWSSHLGLIEKGSFHLGFPWYKPDCSRANLLGRSMRERCDKFDFSRPLFEVPVAYYVRAGDPLAGATDYKDIADRKLCRPAGYFTFDLKEQGIPSKKGKLIIGPTADDCFTWLEDGTVDVVTLGKIGLSEELARFGLETKVAEIPALASSQTLHVVAAKADPVGEAGLALVNKGIEDLEASGRWYEVVSRHLGAFGLTLR
jgi:hypothetical protein